MNKSTKARIAKKAAEGKKMVALPKIPSAGKVRKARPTHPCACGCSIPTASVWAPGHDARARGWAIRIERGLIKMTDVPVIEQAGARLMLKNRKEAGISESPVEKVAKKPTKIKLVKQQTPVENVPEVVNE